MRLRGAERLGATHDMVIVAEGAREPNGHEFMRGWNSLDRWIAMCEFPPLHDALALCRPEGPRTAYAMTLPIRAACCPAMRPNTAPRSTDVEPV